MQTQGDRSNHASGGYSKELNVQNVRYFMEFSSCLEKRYMYMYSLICLENWQTKIFQINNNYSMSLSWI